MSKVDREHWERKHRSPSDAAPRATVEWIPAARSNARLALDVACGQGRHARVLLEAGYDVIGVDIARAALSAARRQCQGARRKFIALQADLDLWPFRDEHFDLIVQFDFLDRRLFDSIKDSTRRGGLVLVDTFRAGSALGGHRPGNPDFLLRDGELERLFAGWDVLAAATVDTPVPRAAMLARRPSNLL